ncbi:class I poly(R)-hydroxyalkanoic acid synthase, partial [Rhizobium ruizarguesonis]
VLPPEEMVTYSKQGNGGKAGFYATDLDPYLLKDPEAMAMNFAKALENIGQAASAWLAPSERGEITNRAVDPMTDMVKTLYKV